MVLYPVFTHPYAWFAGRVIIGFCFSGVYVTGDITPEYLARLEEERSDGAKARRDSPLKVVS